MRCQTLDADSLARELAGAPRPFVLDVRPVSEFEAGHIPGARSLPVHEMARRSRELPSSRVARIVLIGEPGRRTTAAANWLALMGFVDVAVPLEGLAAYAGPLETGPAPPPPPAGPELRVIP
jgi:rhodanese-related sulfurtransferase